MKNILLILSILLSSFTQAQQSKIVIEMPVQNAIKYEDSKNNSLKKEIIEIGKKSQLDKYNKVVLPAQNVITRTEYYNSTKIEKKEENLNNENSSNKSELFVLKKEIIFEFQDLIKKENYNPKLFKKQAIKVEE